jgi:flavin reductase (DIM6/NTAB) family NADH-FMN oxidoreductase RutF
MDLHMPKNLTEFGDLLDTVVDPVLWVVTARFGDEQSGLIATFVQNASLVPSLPRMLAAIAKHHYTWNLIENSRSFALHLVGETRLEWVDRFGLHSGRMSDKFTNLQTTRGTTGSPLLEDAVLWMECRVEASLDTGDRTVYLAEVVDVGTGADDKPLRLKRMLELLPEHQRSELQRMTANDITLDTAAISAWRVGENKPVRTESP